MDIIIRYVKVYGYLGILIIDGKEVYRTGDFKKTSQEALASVNFYIEKYVRMDLLK